MTTFTIILKILALVFIDQFSKFLFRSSIVEDFTITSFFRLTFVENEGVAFSVPFPLILIIPFTFLVLFFLWKKILEKTLKKYERFAFLLVFSGAVGNLIDRIFFSSVADFLSFWNFPIFNFADVFISLGVGLLFYLHFLSSSPT